MQSNEKDKAIRMNPSVLAFMGDGVYSRVIREHIIKKEKNDVNKLHNLSAKYVNAFSQAHVVKHLFKDLTGEEQSLVKRARNKKYITKAKNADPVTYKLATAFEALIGYLYLSGDDQRLQWIMDRSISITESKINIGRTAVEGDLYGEKSFQGSAD